MQRSAKNKPFAVIGAGISGLSVARMLAAKGYSVTLFEKESTPGGLVRCERVDGVLYHCVGGHVFNSLNKEVLNWFWQQCNKDDFQPATRYAVVSLADGTRVDFPIENHPYQMPAEMRDSVLDDVLQIVSEGYQEDTPPLPAFPKAHCPMPDSA